MLRIDLKTLIIGTAIATVFATSAVASKMPDKMVLTPESETALVVMKSDMWEPAPSMRSTFKLWLSGYDETEAKLLGESAVFEAQKKKFFEGYLIAPIKPGRWVYRSYAQQDLWALCFNANSWQFDVKAGEVVYLGQFDAQSHRQQLVEQTAKSGKAVISGYGFADFFDLPEGPIFAPIDDQQMEDVKAAIGRHAAKITAPVRAAEYVPAKFGTGSTLFAERRCGGYFTTSANKKTSKAKPDD